MSTFDASSPQQGFILTSGDDDTFTITYQDADGNVQDITGWTFWLTIKENKSDTDAEAVVQKTVTSHTDPTNGKTEIDVDAADTEDLAGNYWYDMQREDENGDIKTFAHGVMSIREDTTVASG